MNKNWIGGGFISCAVIFCGCTNQEPPHSALTAAESAVSAAEARGAQQVPQASLHLKMAKDSIAQAEELIKEDEFDAAHVALQRAEMDAKLAESLATEEEAKGKAREQMERVNTLQQSNAQRSTSAAGG